MKLLSVILLLGAFGCVLGAKILVVLPMPSRSHGSLMESLTRELGSRGHQVTYLAALEPAKGPPPNTTVIYVPGVAEAMAPMKANMKNMFKGQSPWFIFLMSSMGPTMSEAMLSDPAVQDLILSDQEFDLVLGEIFLDESVLAGLAHRFNAPLVGVMAFLPNIWGNYLVGNPAQTSYIPESTLGLTTRMTFCERLYNFIFSMVWEFVYPMLYLPKHDAVMRNHFSQHYPPIHDILRDTSLVLVNHHHSLAFPRPYLPNMVEVAGFHIAPVKPLPEKFQKFMDDSKQGVILFSLGSNIQSSHMPVETREAILRAFARLPYNVLWKFEEQFDNLPKNVKVDKWLPQSDLLAHPNLKLFITHGGQLSTTEAVTRGVPVLGIPIFGDQPLNMKLCENAGFGKLLNFNDITEDVLYNHVMELTTNPRYRETAKLKSAQLKDEVLPPMDRAMWWIDYVLRHKGAKHLRSPAQNLCWFQLHQIDVIVVVLIGGVSLAVINLLIARAVFRAICNKFCGGSGKKSQKKVKKN